MPSALFGLFKPLTWGNFKGRPPAGTPWAAMTASNFTVTPGAFEPVGRKFRMRDELKVTVSFDENTSWRIDMSQWPASLEKELLEHEQGHYDITALVARDLFITLMKFKNSEYASQAEGLKNIRDFERIYRENHLKRIQKAYDDDTGHSQANVFTPSTNMFTPPVPTKSSTQTKWEGLIAKAFTTPRVPAESAPDGTPYKAELVKVLVDAGIQLPP
jgi:hypothetical protein